MKMRQGEEGSHSKWEHEGLLSLCESLGGCTKFWRDPHTNPTKIGEDRATHYTEYRDASSMTSANRIRLTSATISRPGRVISVQLMRLHASCTYNS